MLDCRCLGLSQEDQGEGPAHKCLSLLEAMAVGGYRAVGQRALGLYVQGAAGFLGGRAVGAGFS